MASTRSLATLLLALTISPGLPLAAQAIDSAEFVSLPPCRVVDTRNAIFPPGYGIPILEGGALRNVTMTGRCGVPANAIGVSVNLTITQPVAAGHITVFPAGGAEPVVSSVNWLAGQTVANAAIVPLGTGGAFSVRPLVSTHLIIDVNGYFADAEELSGLNTAVGENALANIASGAFNNTAVGFNALNQVTTGSNNTGVGSQVLGGSAAGAMTGEGNVAVGPYGLLNLTAGYYNIAVGLAALIEMESGSENIAIGRQALSQATTANLNIAIGGAAGATLTTGSNNIHIGSAEPSVGNESNTIRIGRPPLTIYGHTSTFIHGVSGQTSPGGVSVLVNAAGKLGTSTSSRHVKDEIRDMGEGSQALLRLRPVTFRYKAEHDDGQRLLQYGLIAEEVSEIYPELVVLDKEGQPAGVRYHVLPAMLLNELQRQQRQLDGQTSRLAEQDARLAAQQAELDALRAQARLIDELTARLSRLEAKGAATAAR